MRHKEFVLNRIDAQINLIENLKKSIEANIINKPEALNTLHNIQKTLELVSERVGLENQE
jgi:hypothetical protein